MVKKCKGKWISLQWQVNVLFQANLKSVFEFHKRTGIIRRYYSCTEEQHGGKHDSDDAQVSYLQVISVGVIASSAMMVEGF